MNLKGDLKLIENSEVFKKWNKDDSYLVSCFFMDNNWQFDFYSKKTKKISSFGIEGVNIKMIDEDSAVFQKEQKDLEELDLTKIKTKIEEAIKIVDKIKKEVVPLEAISKKIIILQKINVPLWNISYITSAFNLLNVKINAINSKIIEKNFDSIISFKK
ncbi:hypothetical protein HYV88_05855 [Candidatus Woesearchaeota archaeon]|nr:hypothetical protein [Candidatus Woesearchaeota archaeon]